ncbi:MAG: glycosyltransferase [Gemmatimonadales bacterium]
MSVVLATPGDFTTIAATVRHLRRQTIADRVELVVVTGAAEALSAGESAFDGFWGHQVVGLGRVVSAGQANAAGVRAARASVVALAEDHCFPEPEWAEALLDRHARGDVAAVGPVFRNANPATLVSWCDFVIGYGPWIEPGTTGDQPFLPGHNSSYRRAVLLEAGARLGKFLDAETVLHLELRRQGHRLVLEPRARSAHTNFGRVGSWLPVQYYHGRVFAAERARRWAWPKRAFYAAASPLIPGVRFVRAVRHLHRAQGPRPALARLGPLLALGLAADGLGQFVGYLCGAGGASRQLARCEFGRIDHVPERDRQLWADVVGQTESPDQRA